MSDATMERMTAAEIRESYAAAKYPDEQLKILAELNLCKKQDIRDIIEGKTDELPPVKIGRRRDPHTYYISTAKRKEIIERHAAGETVEELAAAYSATMELIQQILEGTYKKNKPKPPEGGPPAEPDVPAADPDDVNEPRPLHGPVFSDLPIVPGPPTNPQRTILEIAAEAFTETDRRYRDAEYLEITKHGDRLTVQVANDESDRGNLQVTATEGEGGQRKMSGHNIMDEGIIKDLERLSEEDPDGFSADVLAYINRQNAEIKSYRKELGIGHLYGDVLVHTKTLEDYYKFKKSVKAEAIKEFAEREKKKMQDLARMQYGSNEIYFLISESFIDTIAEELMEGTK